MLLLLMLLLLLLLFLLLSLLFYVLLRAWVPANRSTTGATKNWNRRNLVSFQSNETKLGSAFIKMERTIRFGCCIVSIYPASVLKKSVCVWKSAWSSMIWIVLHSLFLFLYSFNMNTDWTRITTVISATTPRNSVLLHCILMPYCRIFHCQNGIFELFFNMRQYITNPSTNSTYDRALK